MSTFRHPVGPEPSRVYWRRRLLVVLGILVVVVVIVLLVIRPGSGDAANAPTASPTPTPTDPTPSSTASTAPSASPSSTAVAGGACDPADIQLAAITDTNSYAEGQLPQLSFRITNVGEVSCTINLGTTQQTFLVTSGEEPYWSSRDCLQDAADADITLEPDVAQTSSPIQWDRTRSSTDTCATERPAVPAGGATYSLSVAVGDIQSTPTSFLLN